MQTNPEIFRGYDIRGVAEKDLDAESMELIGRAHAAYLSSLNVKKVVVGSDNRLTSEEYRQAVIKGLVRGGMEVVDMGMCMTSVVYWAQYHFDAKGAVMVTASHNPAEYNGVKLGRNFSDTLTPIDKIKEMVLKKDFVDKNGGVKVADPKYKQIYLNEILTKIGPIKPFKVVVDASNGAAGAFIPDLLRQAGCDVIEQNCELNGAFPNGTPDPTEGKVAQRLADRVMAEKADIGFSYDGDGDRMGLVDEKGGLIWNDVLVALFSDDVLADHPGAPIVYNALCSQVAEKTISKAGGKPVVWLTGHAYIKDKVNELKAPFGGELSGHFYFMADFYGHDDAAYASLRVLRYLMREKKKLSEIIAGFPRFISSPEIKIGCPDSQKFETIKKIQPIIKKDFEKATINDMDGIRADFQDGMIVIRASQNGPYLTVKFEAQDNRTYQIRREYIKTLLKKYPEINWNSGTNLEVIS